MLAYLLQFVFICCISRRYLLSFIVTCCQLLSFVVTCCYSISFVVTRCTARVSFYRWSKINVTCFLPVQLRTILANFLHVEYGIWRRFEYDFCQISKLEFFISCNTILIYKECIKKELLEYPSFSLLSLCVLICNFFKKTYLMLPSRWYVFVFLFLYEIYTFKDNLNIEEMLTSWCDVLTTL